MHKISIDCKNKIKAGGIGKMNKSMMFNGSLIVSFASSFINNMFNNIANGIAYSNGDENYHNIYDSLTPTIRLGSQAKNTAMSFW